MTYCCAISVDAGIVFCSDSRTNAGMDQVSTYSKMFTFELGPDRQFVVMAAGNLATTQATLAQMKKDIRQKTECNLDTVTTIGEAADYIGEVSRAQQEKHNNTSSNFEASFILGGQIGGSHHRVVMIYPQGNHITSSKDTPYLQIGESKYGKPILDRIIQLDTTLETAALCALVSMDSTMRSNLTVGPPIEMIVYPSDTYNLSNHHRFEEDDEYLRELKKSWDSRLKEAFHQLPPLAWAKNWNKINDSNSGVY
ncbi:MAG: peptidase [Gammaproteobacteria bacterium]|jgi:putative proteasome-type protease|nr:peptidase [Gammaproteobacteria bacterium]MBT6042070.1 peptidase [Gammaproteobacteria bacterium]